MITIIIVTYNSKDFIRKCLDSIYKSITKHEFEIIIVDNKSSDNTVDIVYREYKNVHMIRNNKNYGFAVANNIAIERARGEHILVLNPDTIIEGDAIDIMADYLEKHTEAGCVGAKLLNFDGSLQLSCRRFPNFLNVFFGRRSILRYVFPHNPISREFMLEDMNYNCVQEIDWVMGAAMMLRRETLLKTGFFDEQFFLFVEDTDLCYRMQMEGMKIVYLPSAVIKHYHGGSVKKGFSKAQLHHNLGMYKFFKKYSVKNPVSRMFLYCAIVMRLFSVFFIEEAFFVLQALNIKSIKK